MRALRVLAATFLVGGLLPLGVAVPGACAAEGPHAALVVDTEAPGGQYRYCVALPDGSVTGIELIELASEQHGLQYRLGYGGNVVCQLAGVGYDSDECLKSGPEFWGYWRGDGSGGWDWSSTGGNGTTVEDGDVEGWSWGTGNDGSTHPAPPETTFVSVCGKPPGGGGGDPDPKDQGPRGGGKKSDGNDGRPKEGKASAATPSIEEQVKAAEEAAARRDQNRSKPRGDREKQGRKKKQEKQRSPRPAPSHTPSPVASSPSPSVRPTSAPGQGPPAGGLLAAGAVAACIGGAVFLQRRRVRAK